MRLGLIALQQERRVLSRKIQKRTKEISGLVDSVLGQPTCYGRGFTPGEARAAPNTSA